MSTKNIYIFNEDNRKDVESSYNKFEKITTDCESNRIPPEVYEKEIRNLADLEGLTIQVSAYFTRYGHISNPQKALCNDLENITLLLKKPFTFVNGEYRLISSHCWIPNNESLHKCNLHHGDKVTFFATVKKYKKKSGKEDYTFFDIHNASVLQRNNIPVKMGVFEFSSPFIREICCYTSFKGDPVQFKQEKVNINGVRYRSKDNITFNFKLKDIDKNGIFRFYFKTPNSISWNKYAYFFPNKGQKLFFVTKDKVSKIFIDERTYYMLKDAYADFAYAGDYHFPIKSNKIKSLAKKDSLPNRIECCLESKRITRSDMIKNSDLKKKEELYNV